MFVKYLMFAESRRALWPQRREKGPGVVNKYGPTEKREVSEVYRESDSDAEQVV
jgi:hypothetical protein